MEPDLIQNYNAKYTGGDFDDENYGPNLIRMKITDQVKELQTVLRDRFVVVLLCLVTS